MQEMELLEAINRGAALLDVVWPRWFLQVDLKRFDMWSDRWGLLEQICGSKDKAIEGLAVRDSAFASKLAQDRDNAVYNSGFNVRAGKGAPEWKIATDHWVGHVLRRLREHEEKPRHSSSLAQGTASGPEI